MIINRDKLDIEICEEESELDIQYSLVKILEKRWVKCSQNCTIIIHRKINENKLDYWKEQKIKKQISKKIYVDILAFKKWTILIIEMKKKSKHSKREMWYIWSQLSKYQETWFPVVLCEWREWFKKVLEYF